MEGRSAAGGLPGFALLVAYVVWAFALFEDGTTPDRRMLDMWAIKEDGSHAEFFTVGTTS